MNATPAAHSASVAQRDVPARWIRPSSGSMDAREDLDEGRFPRAILAEERVDFAGFDIQIEIVERERSGKALRDPANGEQRDLSHDGGSHPCASAARCDPCRSARRRREHAGARSGLRLDASVPSARKPVSVTQRVSPSKAQLVGATAQVMKPSDLPSGASTWMPLATNIGHVEPAVGADLQPVRNGVVAGQPAEILDLAVGPDAADAPGIGLVPDDRSVGLDGDAVGKHRLREGDQHLRACRRAAGGGYSSGRGFSGCRFRDRRRPGCRRARRPDRSGR